MADQPRTLPRGFSTLAVHGGEAREKAFFSLTDPIVCAATYSFENTQAVIDFIEQDQPRGEYGRYGNPNELVVEQKLAALEGGESALLFSTGMSAFVCFLMAKLSAGDELIFFDECYRRSRDFCQHDLAKFGVVTREVPTGDFAAMEAAITPRTKLLISESPTNPHLSVIDLDQFAALGKKYRIETLIDATLATPFNLRPLAAGVDYVLHSVTKYLAGHNDLLAGALVGSAAGLASARTLRGIIGVINSAHNCYLLQRGLKTFSLRMQRHNANGQAVAEFLSSHPAVAKVYYPGLPSHPQYELARRTMLGCGGLVTFELRDPDWRTAARVCDAVKLFRIAPSLGGVESLIEQPLVISYFKLTPEQRRKVRIPDNMIRISCGIEDSADLIADLQQALATGTSARQGALGGDAVPGG